MKITRKFSHASQSSGNLIFEGDNLHSLQTLIHTHSQKVDCIYIDPPYNTGNNHFVYKDNFKNNDKNPLVSEWFNFMKPRLEIGHKLLKEDGIFFMSIDDSELASALMLLDFVFSKNNRLAVFCKKLNGGKNDSKFIRKNHEYLLVYGKSKNSVKRLKGKEKETINQTDQQLNKWGDNDRRADRPNLYYPIYVNEKTGSISIEKFPGSVAVYPIKSNKEEGCWRWSKNKVDEEKKRLLIKRRSNGELGIYVKADAMASSEGAWDSVIENFSTGGGEQIKELFGDSKVFTYAKNLDYIKWILSLVNGNDLLFLDFFAGSGTTAHAIIELNATDDKKRKYILCSNTEATATQPNKNICRQICAERVKKAYSLTESKPRAQDNGFDYFEVAATSKNTRKQQIDSVLAFFQIKLNLKLGNSPLTDNQEDRNDIYYAGTDTKGIACFVSFTEVSHSIVERIASKTARDYKILKLKSLPDVKELFCVTIDETEIQLQLIA